MLHMQVNKELSEPECEHLNAVYNRFINQIQHVSKQENNRNWILCICSHVSGNVWSACSNSAIIGDPYNTPWSNPPCHWSNSRRNWFTYNWNTPESRIFNPNTGICPSKSRKNIRIRTWWNLLPRYRQPDSSAFMTAFRHRSYRSSVNSKSCAIPESKAAGPFWTARTNSRIFSISSGTHL